jgi:hypothetical protein
MTEMARPSFFQLESINFFAHYKRMIVSLIRRPHEYFNIRLRIRKARDDAPPRSNRDSPKAQSSIAVPYATNIGSGEG